VADRHAHDFALPEPVGEGRVDGFGAQMHLFADVVQSRVAHKRAGQEAGFGENLEAIADA
jgi:hypothetical protein